MVADLRQDGRTCAHGVDDLSNKRCGHLIGLCQHYLLTSVNPEPTPRHLRRTHCFRQPHHRRRRHHNHSRPYPSDLSFLFESTTFVFVLRAGKSDCHTYSSTQIVGHVS